MEEVQTERLYLPWILKRLSCLCLFPSPTFNPSTSTSLRVSRSTTEKAYYRRNFSSAPRNLHIPDLLLILAQRVQRKLDILRRLEKRHVVVHVPLRLLELLPRILDPRLHPVPGVLLDRVQLGLDVLLPHGLEVLAPERRCGCLWVDGGLPDVVHFGVDVVEDVVEAVFDFVVVEVFENADGLLGR